MSGHSRHKRIGLDGRILGPEETVAPSAYRPEERGLGLHAILEKAQPWRDGKPVPLDGPLKRANILLLWFRIDDLPIEGSPVWDRSAEVIAPGLAIALTGLAADSHLVLTVRTDPDQVEQVVIADFCAWIRAEAEAFLPGLRPIGIGLLRRKALAGSIRQKQRAPPSS